MDSVMALLAHAKESAAPLDPKFLKIIEPLLIVRESTLFETSENL